MKEVSQKSENLFMAGMLASMFCWGLSWASGKVLAGYGEPANIALFRFGLTFLSLFVILLFFKQPLKIKKQGLITLVCASAFIAVYTYLFFKGLVFGKAGAGGVLVTTLNPIISYAVMLALVRRKPTTSEAVGLVIGLIAGATLLKVWSNWENIFSPGNIYFVLACLSWAVLSLFTAKSSKYGSPVTFSLWMYGLSSLVMLSITGFQDNSMIFTSGDSYFWGNLFFSATITTGIATTFYFVATSKMGAGKASSFIFLVPVSAALGSWIFLEEIPDLSTVIGGVLGIVAVYIINRKSDSNSTLKSNNLKKP